MNSESGQRSGGVHRQTREQPRRTSAERSRILLVDDDELILDSLCIVLKKHGYDIVTSQSGFEALEILDEKVFGLLICDIRMPGADGVKVVRALRETGRLEINRNIPVILITAYSDFDVAKAAQGLDIVGCLGKPIDDSQMLTLVKTHLRLPQEELS